MPGAKFYVIEKKKLDHLISAIGAARSKPIALCDRLQELEELIEDSMLIQTSKKEIKKIKTEDIDQVLDYFCQEHEISKQELKGKSRDSKIVKYRKEFFYQAKSMGFHSRLIAKALNRDHSTVSYYLTTRDNNVPTDKR